MSISDERVYWLAFSLCNGIGPKKFNLLLKTFKTAENAWRASKTELTEIIGPSQTEKLINHIDSINLDKYLEQMESKRVWFLTLPDSEYPGLLRESYNPPFVLFGKGSREVFFQAKTIGIVGTRKITGYGRQVTELMTEGLSRAGFCIVSGLAMGVDAVAHATALESKGKTIAVLGCGVDCCSPSENYNLYEKIIESGSIVVSEYPLGIAPTKGSFPSRNRIIAGLSQAILVTEGAEDSGALITASDSFKNNRPVFAVPGPITSSLSKGPNELLKIGGRLVTSSDDVLLELGIRNSVLKLKNTDIKGDSADEQMIIDLIRDEELSFDELLQKTLFDSSKMNMTLSMMEMKDMVLITENGSYTLKNY